MQTELGYLLDELEKHNYTDTLTVGNLIKIIKDSMNKAASDEVNIFGSLMPDGDMH